MRRILLCLLLCIGAAIGFAGPAAAEPDDDDIPVDSLMELELDYFTASPRSVPAGGASTLRWKITGTTPAVIRLDGRQVGRTDSTTIHPQARDETHTLTASALGATRTMGTIRVGATPCESPASPVVAPVVGGPVGPGQQIPDTPDENAPVEGQCSRPGTAWFSYERIREQYAYRSDINLSPRTGSIRLDACSTDPGRHGRIERYDWTITPSGSSPAKQISTDQCLTGFGPYATGNPPYTVRMRARASDGEVLERTAVVPVKDLLVVSLGDSMASGEGNPDQPGNYLPVPLSEAFWQHSACHRSARAGHSKAAVAIDHMEKRTGMLFMSLACSGATVDDLVSNSHSGQPPQLTELRSILCRFDCDRPIDVLMLTVGINHLGFADVVKHCKVLPVSSGCGGAVAYAANNVGIVSDKLTVLRNRINALGLNVRRIIITEYPANVFDNGCSSYSTSIGAIGNRLNQEIATSAASFGWGYASGIVSGFQGHNYCASESYFRGFTASLDTQGDVEGTAHPNGTGQSVIATRIASRYVSMGAANAIDEGPFVKSAQAPVDNLIEMRKS